MAVNFLLTTATLDSARYLTGTQATGAGIDTTGRTVHNSPYSLDVRLPSTVGATVRVRHLNPESNFFIADFTFCHGLHLLFDTARHTLPQ